MKNPLLGFLALAALLGSSEAMATGGKLSGRLTNDAGAAVPFAQVTWGGLCPVGGTPGHAYTDVNGYWTSPTLANGKYSVTAGNAPCSKTVYLCGSDNTKTVIANADVGGVDFRHDLEVISGNVGTGGSISFTIGYSSDRPTQPVVSGSFSQAVPCGEYVTGVINTIGNYILTGVTVDGVSQGTYTSFGWGNCQSSHTVSATYVPGPTTGACCAGFYYPNYSCSQGTFDECSQSGGYFMGFGTTCPSACYPVKTRGSSWGKLKSIYR